MRKKVIALLLCCAMTAGVLAGCGNAGSVNKDVENNSTQAEESSAAASSESESVPEETEEEPELLKISWMGIDGGTEHDDFTRWIEDKFNVELELMENGGTETFSLLATSGSLADYNHQQSFNFEKYYEFVDQGTLKALPDGWEEKWPNLYRMLDNSGLLELLEVDGEIYSIPHATLGQQVMVDAITHHGVLCWRKDWAEEVGMGDMNDDYIVTISELKEYLEAVEAAGITENNYIYSFPYYLKMAFGHAHKLESQNDFVDRGNTYVWSPSTPEFKEMVKTMQEWYQEGLIYPEFYDADHNEGPTLISAGECAAVQTDGIDVYEFYNIFEKDYPDKELLDTIGFGILTGDDEVVYANEVSNYWSWSFFAPESDDAVTERILDIVDYACSEEGQIAWALGIPEQDWTFKADGTIEQKNTNIDELYPNRYGVMGVLGYCNDDFNYSPLNPSRPAEMTQIVLDMYNLKAKGYVYPVSWAYSNDRSELKTAYSGSVKVNNFLSQAVVSTDDAEKLVNDFVESNRSLWEPLLEEVNELAGYGN